MNEISRYLNGELVSEWELVLAIKRFTIKAFAKRKTYNRIRFEERIKRIIEKEKKTK